MIRWMLPMIRLAGRKIFYGCLLLVCQLIASGEICAQTIPKLRIDPDHAYGGMASDYFEGVEYIPLETSKESLFGDINQLIVTDSSYVVGDLDTRSILFFSRTGEFIKRVRDYGVLFHDKVKKRIGFLKYSRDMQSISAIFYSLKGLRLPVPESPLQQMNGGLLTGGPMMPLKENFYLYSGGCAEEKGIVKGSNGPCYFLSVYKKDTLYRKLLPVTDSISLATSRIWGHMYLPKVVENGAFYVSTPLEYALYRVNSDTAEKIYQLVFPHNRVLPMDILRSGNLRLLDSVKNTFTKNETLILNVDNVFFIGSKLFFKLVVPSYVVAYNTSVNKYQYNFIYDTRSGKLVTLDRITPDATSFFLPMLSENSKSKGAVIFNKELYSYLSSLQMFLAMESVKGDWCRYPPALEAYFKTQNRKSNPVIVRMKLKE